jgi:tetratricopeptide (TPR) repeat protein
VLANPGALQELATCVQQSQGPTYEEPGRLTGREEEHGEAKSRPAGSDVVRETQLDTAGSSASQGVVRDRYLSERLEDLKAELREHLDFRGGAMFTAMEAAVRSRSWTTARARATELDSFLEAKGEDLSATIRGKALVLLADLALIESSLAADPCVCIKRAQCYYEKAARAYGDTPSDDDAARLLSLRAKLTFCERGGEAALQLLDGCDDPRSITTRLAIYLEEGRTTEAAALIENKEVHPRWCSHAIVAHVLSGNTTQAKRLLDSAKDDQSQSCHYENCALAYGEACLQVLAKSRPGAVALTPFNLSPADSASLGEALRILEPIVAAASSSVSPPTGLQAEALSLACSICHLLRNTNAARRYAKPLERLSPLPLEYARAVARGDIQEGQNVVERLRTEHPESFDAHVLACVIEGRLSGTSETAFDKARSLRGMVKTAREKEQLAGLLHDLAQPLGPDQHTKAVEDARELIGPDHKLVRLLEAEEALKCDDVARAERLLSSGEDQSDLLWLQLMADLKRRQGNQSATILYLNKAVELLPVPGLLWQLSRACLDAKDYEPAVSALERLAEFEPKNIQVLSHLAYVYHTRGRFGDAAKRLTELCSLQPREDAHALNLAVCLGQSGDRDGAMEVFERLCARQQPPLTAVLGRAQLLHAAGRPDRAFTSLDEAKSLFWSEPLFLLQYLSLGYSARREAEAHEAFCRLLELRRHGKVPEGLLWQQSIEDLPKLMKKWQEDHRRQNHLLLQGRVPWLMVDTMRNEPSRLAWRYRTQKCMQTDDADSRADLAVYASHHLAVVQAERGPRRLQPIECAPPQGPVVADVTALLTLDELGLLDKAAEFFGQIRIPTLYKAQWEIDEPTRLQSHQPSRSDSGKAILHLVDTHAIRTATSAGNNVGGLMPFLSEYDDLGSCSEMPYRLRDVIDWMKARGAIGAADLATLSRHVSKPARSTPEAFSNAIGQAGVLCDVATLRTLHDAGYLDKLVASLPVHVGNEELESLRREMYSFEFQGIAYQAHQRFCEMIRRDARFSTIDLAPIESVEKDDHDESSRLNYAIASGLLAQQEKLPLLADDRMLQAWTLGRNPACPHAAFGTDQVLRALCERKLVSEAQAKEAFLKLIGWRYRFIVIPPEILLALALDFLDAPPGQPLREVALYVHDCMRDPGLLAGPEPTEPPLSVAAGLFMQWVQTVGGFVAKLWTNEEVPDKAAERFTTWAVEEFLPRGPHNMPRYGQRVLCQGISTLVFSMLLPQAIVPRHSERVNRGLQCLISALRLSDEDYTRQVLEIVDVFGST